MANQYLFEPIHGREPCCNGNYKRGKDNYCPFYYVDEVCEIMEAWRKEAHVTTPILTKYDHNKKKFMIYTTRLGLLIGWHGETYYKYYELLKPELRSHLCDHNGLPNENGLIEFVECNDVIGDWNNEAD